MTPYRNAMVELEQRFLDTPTYSLMFLYTELSRFEDLLEFLLQFIAGIRTERLVGTLCIVRNFLKLTTIDRIFHFRLHGCALLQYLHKNSLHGNKQIAGAVEM